MKLTKRKITKGFTLVELLVVIAIIAALAGFATPLVLKQMKKADMATATHNAKQLHLALFDFDQDVGAFPSTEDPGDFGNAGTSANDVLRQLFFNGNIESEENFYAKTSFSRQPDGDVGDSPTYTTAIEDGECGFLYMDQQSTSVNSSRPLLAAPLQSDTGDPNSLKFDTDTYGGKMIVLRIDGSVKPYKINKESFIAETKIGGQDRDVFSIQNKVWGTVTPSSVALYPKRRSNNSN